MIALNTSRSISCYRLSMVFSCFVYEHQLKFKFMICVSSLNDTYPFPSEGFLLQLEHINTSVSSDTTL